MPRVLRPINCSFFYRHCACILLWLFFSYIQPAFAQTATVVPVPVLRAPCQFNVSSFPYDETFEAGDGGWFSGGQNSDWQRGTPAKAVINAAGQGTKSWLTGGLTGGSYNGNELSWLQSPCFDLTNLIDPEISFKIFWETERRYDGAAIEYSLDGGNTWQQLGNASSNTNCEGSNWFNTTAVTYLGGVPGWSGNIQSTAGSCLGGGGSNGWLIASHSLQAIKNETSVTFRFTFASGTTCNNFEGFAIDALHIGEAPPKDAAFKYDCTADARTINFHRNARCAASTLWNFGDAASGANNTSTDADPIHVFSAPGTYTVTLQTTFATGGPVLSSTQQIVVLGATAAITNPTCFGDANGAITVAATGSSTAYTYSWNTTPPKTTATITGLTAGNYIVTIGTANSCGIKLPVAVTGPSEIVLDSRWGPAICTANNGQAGVYPRGGGVQPFQYLWNNGATTAELNNLSPGNYSVTVTDADGCKSSVNNIVVDRITQTLPVFIGRDTSICPGEKLVLSPGRFSSYKWQDNSTRSTFNVTMSGTYSVTVVNEDGCTGAASVKVNVDCSDVFFPSGFTPNGDTRNDDFGPGGNLAALQHYSLVVYDRYGNRAFYSTNPFAKWNGKYKGSDYNSGAFVWIANYTLNGKLYSKKGTLTLLR